MRVREREREIKCWIEIVLAPLKNRAARKAKIKRWQRDREKREGMQKPIKKTDRGKMEWNRGKIKGDRKGIRVGQIEGDNEENDRQSFSYFHKNSAYLIDPPIKLKCRSTLPYSIWSSRIWYLSLILLWWQTPRQREYHLVWSLSPTRRLHGYHLASACVSGTSQSSKSVFGVSGRNVVYLFFIFLSHLTSVNFFFCVVYRVLRRRWL